MRAFLSKDFCKTLYKLRNLKQETEDGASLNKGFRVNIDSIVIAFAFKFFDDCFSPNALTLLIL